MKENTRRGGWLAAATLLGLLAPATVHADSAGRLDLNSSASAQCIGAGGACNVVQFQLSVTDGPYWSAGGEYWVNYIRLRTNDDTPWRFSAVGNPVEVRDGNGVALSGWELMTQYSNEFTLKTNGEIGIDPIYLVVNMESWGTSEQFGFLYDGRGCLDPSCTTTVLNPETGKLTNQVAFEGTVTPEPVTMVLLGSGLLGIAGAARRRKEEDVEV